MKRLFYLLPFLCLACSAPKQQYYFDYVKTPPNQKIENEKKPIGHLDANMLTANNEVQPIATHSSQTNTQPSVSQPAASTNNGVSSKATSSKNLANGKELRKLVRSTVKREKKVDHESKTSDSGKNGFAIAGFVCSIVGLFVLWPLCIIGIIFSAIGLKSEKKGLAIAGLIIGIVGVVLVLAAGAALAG